MAVAAAWQASVQQSGVQKLGVSLEIQQQLGKETSLDRADYRLVMRQYECSIRRPALLDAQAGAGPALLGETPVCPQTAFPDVTQYQHWKYGTAADLEPAAAKGSLCCQMYLAYLQASLRDADGRTGAEGSSADYGTRARKPAARRFTIDHAVLIPGNGCGRNLNTCMWYPWLAKKLTDRGISIDLRGFPDHYHAHEHIWKAFVVEKLELTPSTLVIGHSSGAACALRLMEEHPFAACLLVSAYDTDMGDEVERESGYFNRPFDYKTMQRHVPRIAQLHSASDHLVPVAVARRVAQGLAAATSDAAEGAAVYVETADDGHFQDDEYEALMWPVVERMLSGQ